MQYILKHLLQFGCRAGKPTPVSGFMKKTVTAGSGSRPYAFPIIKLFYTQKDMSVHQHKKEGCWGDRGVQGTLLGIPGRSSL